jgi:Predicted epimerase, PhzC/PhzF homolog
VDVTDAMEEALGVRPAAAYMGRDLLCVYDDGAVIEAMTPDFAKVKTLDGLLVHVTARGKVADTVSRSFAPKLSVQEDPVCGSGHCHIVPYWAERLGKDEIVAYQASRRGGTIYCRVAGEKIFMAGKAALYSEAEIYID